MAMPRYVDTGFGSTCAPDIYVTGAPHTGPRRYAEFGFPPYIPRVRDIRGGAPTSLKL